MGTLIWRLAVGLWLGMALGGPAGPQAQTGPRLLSAPSPTYEFGESLSFELTAESDEPITGVTVYIRAPNEARAFAGKAIFASATAITATYSLNLDRVRLIPFTSIEYWWEIEDRTGATAVGERQSFVYADNRFDWQSVSQPPVTVHWHAGGRAFGQSALDIATAALADITAGLQATLPDRVDLYLYQSTQEAGPALRSAGHSWKDGVAFPEFGVVLVTVSSTDVDAETRLGREIPHEVAHIVVAQLTGGSGSAAPLWLNEGLAMMSQASLEPEFSAMLAAAQQAGSLLPMRSLCGSFPVSPVEAQLAYAQSESFVRFIRDRHGNDRLAGLLAAYGNGVECSAGVEQVLGAPLDALEAEWLGARAPAPAAPPFDWLPWLGLGGLVLFAPLLFFLLIRLRAPRANRMV